MTSEDDCRTWIATLDKDFKLTAKLFTYRGGNSVVTDADGNVYIADGNVSVYDKNGKQMVAISKMLDAKAEPDVLAYIQTLKP